MHVLEGERVIYIEMKAIPSNICQQIAYKVSQILSKTRQK